MLVKLTSTPPEDDFLASAVGTLLSLSYSTTNFSTLSNSKVVQFSSTRKRPVTSNFSQKKMLWTNQSCLDIRYIVT